MKKKYLLAFLMLLILAAILAALVYTQFVFLGDRFYRKGARALDLRGRALTPAEYGTFREAFPDAYIIWDVPFQGGTVSSDTQKLTVTAFSQEDIADLAYLPNLQTLNAAGCRSYAALDAFQAARPGCRVISTVNINGVEFDRSQSSIQVENASVAALLQSLPDFPGLSQVTLTGDLPDGAGLRTLHQAFPEIQFCYQLTWGDQVLNESARELCLDGPVDDFDAFRQLLDVLPDLETVDLHAGGLTNSQLEALAAEYPHCCFLAEYTLAGLRLPTDSVEIDLSGHSVSVAEVEAALPCFPNLTRVILCNCGPDDEALDALNRKYQHIRFVWSVTIRDVQVRTDAKYFYPYKFYRNMVVEEEDLYPLRYCTDLEAIDIGHMTTVRTCEWLNYMPNMKYLILVETAITDISPLANLKNLVFLEIFTTKITDYSPLLGCTALEDLNLGNTYGDPAPILQMTWLKNLWWSGIEGNQSMAHYDAPNRLRAALPNTTMRFNLENPNVENGWRQLANYYAMRDLMDVFYLA